MKAPLQIGDKVVLAGPSNKYQHAVPKLVPGRVYCVNKVLPGVFDTWFVGLVGIRGDKRCPRLGDEFQATRFRRIHPARNDQRKEEA